MKNAYKLCGIVVMSVIIMALALWQYYNLPITFTVILMVFEVYNLLVYPIRGIISSFLQLEYSARKTTGNHGISSVIRLGLSCLATPYCTTLGQTVSSTYETISTSIMFKRNYRVTKNGEVERRQL